MTKSYKNPYMLLAAATAFMSLLVAMSGVALAREAESGSGSSGSDSSVSSSGGSSVDDNLPSNSGIDSARDIQERTAAANGIDLRGDGTLEDNGVGGVKLRGDGTVDDNLPRRSGLDDVVGGVKLRGDGTVDDNSTGLFRNDLRVGVKNDDVLRLQNELRAGGLFSEEPTGFFGQQTREAVLRFQRERGLPETGLVGRQTREELNRRIEARLDSSGPSASSGPGPGPNNVRDDARPTVARPIMVRLGSVIGNFFSRFARIFGF